MIIKEVGYNKENYAHFGTKFLIGNGYMGVRGTPEEYTKEYMPAINIAGVYNLAAPDKWRESLNAPNPFFVKIAIGGTELALPDATNKVLLHEQSINMALGIHLRKTVFKTQQGQVNIESRRFASMTAHNILALEYIVTADFDAEIIITSGIDGNVWDVNGPHFVRHNIVDGEIMSVEGVCDNGLSVKTLEKVEIKGNLKSQSVIKEDKRILRALTFAVKKDEQCSIKKVAYVSTSKDLQIAKKTSDTNFLSLTYDELLVAQTEYWKSFWVENFVTIEGDKEAETALNYCIYSLQIIAPRHAKALSIPARGLSGQVYKGAVFWDTEMFMLDYFILNDIGTARTLLKYRIDGLKGARIKAKQEGFDGAFYAWESHENGLEACTKFNVTDVFTGRSVRTYFMDKQVHISAAIVYGLHKYTSMTGDFSILADGGLEIILECADFYMSMLSQRFSHRQDSDRVGKLELHDVVGPDEYHERVNNNAYTNRMAKFVLEYALEVLKKQTATSVSQVEKNRITAYKKKLKKCIEAICQPRTSKDGVIEQFDGYFELEDVSVDEVRSRLKDKREYWGGSNGVASTTKIIKQADVVTMLALFKNEYDIQTLRKNLEYYEKRTEHGSSLSACMYGLLHCYCDSVQDAYPMFVKSAAVDLVTPSKLWAGGIYIGGSHPASWGGAYQMMVYGFAGLTLKQTKKGITPVLNPRLPTHWKRLAFKCSIAGKRYNINITNKKHSIKSAKYKEK
ncbi:MAG: glycoside hydrolase family 65 protein [Firmicutes bacterium]|nr:glycoside hydrolase family 65 protein [Bacillota bacterium]